MIGCRTPQAGRGTSGPVGAEVTSAPSGSVRSSIGAGAWISCAEPTSRAVPTSAARRWPRRRCPASRPGRPRRSAVQAQQHLVARAHELRDPQLTLLHAQCGIGHPDSDQSETGTIGHRAADVDPRDQTPRATGWPGAWTACRRRCPGAPEARGRGRQRRLRPLVVQHHLPDRVTLEVAAVEKVRGAQPRAAAASFRPRLKASCRSG